MIKMRAEKIENKRNEELITFDSLNDFYKYICDTPFNESFRWENHSSVSNGKSFTGTENFQEASDLFKNGWTSMAKTLEKDLKARKQEIQVETKQKNIYDVQGFQCSVPRYLNNVPTSMIRKQNFPAKQKVITLSKSIGYNCNIDKSEILAQSETALMLVKKLESKGFRVNLNIIWGTRGHDGKIFYVKIRIKNANERLNISKLAFPLVNPSMLRRLGFRFIEVYPNITKTFVHGYGVSLSRKSQLENALSDKEYLIPSFINKGLNDIETLEDLQNL